MDYDKEKVDDLTLALLYLVMFEEKHGSFVEFQRKSPGSFKTIPQLVSE